MTPAESALYLGVAKCDPNRSANDNRRPAVGTVAQQLYASNLPTDGKKRFTDSVRPLLAEFPIHGVFMDCKGMQCLPS